jgi:hypothetical protein
LIVAPQYLVKVFAGTIACVGFLAGLVSVLAPAPITSCCADLEETVADLEAIIARSKSGSEITGMVNAHLTEWDDECCKPHVAVGPWISYRFKVWRSDPGTLPRHSYTDYIDDDWDPGSRYWEANLGVSGGYD